MTLYVLHLCLNQEKRYFSRKCSWTICNFQDVFIQNFAYLSCFIFCETRILWGQYPSVSLCLTNVQPPLTIFSLTCVMAESQKTQSFCKKTGKCVEKGTKSQSSMLPWITHTHTHIKAVLKLWIKTLCSLCIYCLGLFLSYKKSTNPYFLRLPVSQIAERNLLACVSEQMHTVNRLLINYIVTERDKWLMAVFYNPMYHNQLSCQVLCTPAVQS